MAAWVVVLIIIGGLIVLLALGLLVAGAERCERVSDLAAEFWDWLKLGR